METTTGRNPAIGAGSKEILEIGEKAAEVGQEIAGGLDRAYQEYIKPIVDDVSTTVFLPSLNFSKIKFPEREVQPKKVISTPTVKSIEDSLDEHLRTVMMLESSGNSRAKAGTSSASGLFQFTNGTWKDMTRRMGVDYSLEDRFDPVKSFNVMREFTEFNRRIIERRLKRKITNVESYIGHFLGAGGAIKLLRADEDVKADSILGRAAASNKALFYKRGSGEARTVGELIAEISSRYEKARNGKKRRV